MKFVVVGRGGKESAKMITLRRSSGSSTLLPASGREQTSAVWFGCSAAGGPVTQPTETSATNRQAHTSARTRDAKWKVIA